MDSIKVSHHGHAQNQWGDEVDRRLVVPLPQLMECVEEICPTHNPQHKGKGLRDRGHKKQWKTHECTCTSKWHSGHLDNRKQWRLSQVVNLHVYTYQVFVGCTLLRKSPQISWSNKCIERYQQYQVQIDPVYNHAGTWWQSPETWDREGITKWQPRSGPRDGSIRTWDQSLIN